MDSFDLISSHARESTKSPKYISVHRALLKYIRKIFDRCFIFLSIAPLARFLHATYLEKYIAVCFTFNFTKAWRCTISNVLGYPLPSPRYVNLEAEWLLRELHFGFVVEIARYFVQRVHVKFVIITKYLVYRTVLFWTRPALLACTYYQPCTTVR